MNEFDIEVTFYILLSIINDMLQFSLVFSIMTRYGRSGHLRLLSITTNNQSELFVIACWNKVLKTPTNKRTKLLTVKRMSILAALHFFSLK